MVEASLFVVDESLFEEFAVDFADDSFVDCALEASDVLEATVVDSAAVGWSEEAARGFKKRLLRTRVVLSCEDQVVDVANGFEMERFRPWC